jgi:hypothetical protein
MVTAASLVRLAVDREQARLEPFPAVAARQAQDAQASNSLAAFRGHRHHWRGADHARFDRWLDRLLFLHAMGSVAESREGQARSDILSNSGAILKVVPRAVV